MSTAIERVEAWVDENFGPDWSDMAEVLRLGMLGERVEQCEPPTTDKPKSWHAAHAYVRGWNHCLAWIKGES